MKIFVTGTFRTGSTLLAYMINAAGVPLKEETVNFMRFCYRRYGQDRVLAPDALRLGRDVNARLARRFSLGFDQEAYDRAIAAAGQEEFSYAFLYGLVMRLFEGGEDWGEKTVLEWRNAEAILDFFPDMKIAHIIRDPRDVLASWKKVTIAPGSDYLDCIANCYDSMLHALRNQERFKERYHVTVFERLVADPEAEARDLCAFMERPFIPQMLAVDSFKSKLDQGKAWDPNVQTEFGDRIEGVSRKPLGRWRQHLSREDVFLCELVNNELMKKFGYEPSGIEWDIHDFFAAWDKITHSPLTLNGLTSVRHFREGVMRYALNPLDASTWAKVEQ